MYADQSVTNVELGIQTVALVLRVMMVGHYYLVPVPLEETMVEITVAIMAETMVVNFQQDVLKSTQMDNAPFAIQDTISVVDHVDQSVINAELGTHILELVLHAMTVGPYCQELVPLEGTMVEITVATMEETMGVNCQLVVLKQMPMGSVLLVRPDTTLVVDHADQSAISVELGIQTLVLALHATVAGIL